MALKQIISILNRIFLNSDAYPELDTVKANFRARVIAIGGGALRPEPDEDARLADLTVEEGTLIKQEDNNKIYMRVNAEDPTQDVEMTGLMPADFSESTTGDSLPVYLPNPVDLVPVQEVHPAVQASGQMQFAANPSDGDTIPSINGVTVGPFKTSAGAFPEIQIGVSLAASMRNLANDLIANVATHGYEGLAFGSFVADVDRVRFIMEVAGAAGNLIPLGASTANITVSGATLTGGTEITSEVKPTTPTNLAYIGVGHILDGTSPSGSVNPNDLSLLRRPAVSRVVRGTLSGGALGDNAGYVVRPGALIGISGDDFPADGDTAAVVAWIDANLSSIPALSVADNGDDTFDITCVPGGNVLEFSSEDTNLTFAQITAGADALNIAEIPSTMVTAAAAAGADLSTAVEPVDTDDYDVDEVLVLTAASFRSHRYTGSTNITRKLPVAVTMGFIGSGVFVDNRNSTATIRYESSGGQLVQAFAPGSTGWVSVLALSGTDATSWSVEYSLPDGVIPSVPLIGDYTTTAGDVGGAWDQAGGEVTHTLTINNDDFEYQAGSCWSGSNLSTDPMHVTLATGDLITAGTGDVGMAAIAQYGTFVVRLLPDGTYLISGVGITLA